MTTDPNAKLTTAQIMQRFALRLKNADPAGWDAFVECFDVYATECTVAMASAPQDQILAQQGRAQQCLALLRLYRECSSAAPRTIPTDPPQL